MYWIHACAGMTGIALGMTEAPSLGMTKGCALFRMAVRRGMTGVFARDDRMLRGSSAFDHWSASIRLIEAEQMWA